MSTTRRFADLSWMRAASLRLSAIFTPCCFLGVIGMLLKYDPDEDLLPDLGGLSAWAGRMLDITEEEAWRTFRSGVALELVFEGWLYSAGAGPS